MNSAVAILFTCFCIIHNCVVTAYLTTPAPPTTFLPTTSASQKIINHDIDINYADTTTNHDVNVDRGDVDLLQMEQSVLERVDIIDYNVEILQMKQQSLLGRAYRRGKKLLTREKEDTTTKTQKEEPEQLWRVMFHNSEYMPDRVARELTKVFPITRMTAFDICVRARSEGTVTVDICHKKQAEKYVRQLSKRGLVATIQPE